MVQEQFRPKLHSPQPDHPTWARCGKFTTGVQMADSDEEVTCGHCMRKLGHDPRAALADAVEAVVTAFDSDMLSLEIEGHVARLAKAWHAERDYVSTRRYYR